MKKLKAKYRRYLIKKSSHGNKKKRDSKRRIEKSVSRNTAKTKSVINVSNSYFELFTPEKFRLQFESCEEVISCVNRIKRIGNQGNNININMSRTVEIGEGAIAMLLSVLEELNDKGIRLRGTKPLHLEARNVLEKSGFFKFVTGSVSDANKASKNTILKTGDNNTPVQQLSTEIIKSMETVWEVKGRCPAVYSAVFEMMRNSCDHAFKHKHQIKWHFAISHLESLNEVKFAFVDNGKGVINTFINTILKKVLYMFKDNADILESAFKNGIASRTGLTWRGKGLPNIFEHYEEKHIKNLVVISNNVYIDFDRNIHHILAEPFSGTYYFWKVNRECQKQCFELKNSEK